MLQLKHAGYKMKNIRNKVLLSVAFLIRIDSLEELGVRQGKVENYLHLESLLSVIVFAHVHHELHHHSGV